MGTSGSLDKAHGNAAKVDSSRRTAHVAMAMALALAACGGADKPAGSSTTADDQQSPPLRDVRYCEVIPSVAQGATVLTSVYNTLGYNDCPRVKWVALTEDEVNREFGSQTAKLNGPRHWVIDSLKASGSSQTGQTFTFGGIEMGLRATQTTQAGQATAGELLYTPNQVKRDTVWIYDAGKQIFELVDPAGNVYVMQSYSEIVDRTLTIRQLPDLAGKLALPPGWSYRSEMLSSGLELDSNGLAIIVNDNLYNTYQRRM